MKYCESCDKSINDNADYCIYCGSKQNKKSSVRKEDEELSFFLKLFCLFIPVLGFAMYFYYIDINRANAKKCLTLAVINITLDAIVAALTIILPIILNATKIISFIGE